MNELIVTKVTTQADKHSIIDWLYGNDEKSIGGSTIIDFSDTSFGQRSDFTIAKNKLLNQVSIETFELMLNSQQLNGA